MGTRTALSYPRVRWFGALRAFSSSRSRSRFRSRSRSRCVPFCRVGRGGWVATHLRRRTPRDPPGPGATHLDPARQLSSPRNRTGYRTRPDRTDRTGSEPNRTRYRNRNRTETGPEPEPDGDRTRPDCIVDCTVDCIVYFTGASTRRDPPDRTERNENATRTRTRTRTRERPQDPKPTHPGIT